MRENYYNNSKDYINRWVISYADLVTLLLALFLAMYAINVTDNKQHPTGHNPYSPDVTMVKTATSPELQKTLLKTFQNDRDITLLKDPRGVIIRVNDEILFGNAESSVQKNSYATMNKIIDILSKINNPVIIEGHTDSSPIKSVKYTSNWELSTARATSVIDYLVSSKKINPRRLSAVGYGEYMPIAENTSNSGRMRNRRVDIIILNNTGE